MLNLTTGDMLTVAPIPLLVVETDRLEFGDVRKPRTSRRAVRLLNPGGAPITVHLTGENDCLAIIPNQPFTISQGSSQTVMVTLSSDLDSVAVGEFVSQISIAVTGLPGTLPLELPDRIRVRANVQRRIRLTATPDHHSFGEVPVPEYPEFNFTVERDDGEDVCLRPDRFKVLSGTDGKVDWEVEGKGAQQEVKLTFHTANCDAETYQTVVELREDNPVVEPVEVTVTANVVRAPTFELEQPEVTMLLAPGERNELQCDIVNAGGGILEGEIGSESPWLKIKSSNRFRLGPEKRVTLVVTVDASKLQVGHHELPLAVTANHRGRRRLRPCHFPVEVCAPELQVVEFFPDFGSVARGEAVQHELVCKNAGGGMFRGILRCEPQMWLHGPANFTVQAGQEARVPIKAVTRALNVPVGGETFEGAVSIFPATDPDHCVWEKNVSVNVQPGSFDPIRHWFTGRQRRRALTFSALAGICAVLLTGIGLLIARGRPEESEKEPNPVNTLAASQTKETPAPKPAKPVRIECDKMDGLRSSYITGWKLDDANKGTNQLDVSSAFPSATLTTSVALDASDTNYLVKLTGRSLGTQAAKVKVNVGGHDFAVPLVPKEWTERVLGRYNPKGQKEIQVVLTCDEASKVAVALVDHIDFVPEVVASGN